MRIAILGAGRVGAAMARDLAADGRDLLVLDPSEEALDDLHDLEGLDDGREGAAVELRRLGGSSGALERAIETAELVVGAVPGPIGFATARRVVDAGKHLVDISFFEEDAFALDEPAQRSGVVCCVDCGIAPGFSNLVLGHAEATLDEVHAFTCLVGGLPVERRMPWQYTAPFSPIDVLAEYTRPARLRERGETVERPALGGVERVEIPGVGTLEAFETDGLRTLLRTSTTPDLVEKTLRYPGHRDAIELLRDVGFLGEAPVELADGSSVRPIDLAAALLFPQWRPEERDGRPETELTVMRCIVEGTHDDAPVRWTWDVLDHSDRDTGVSSMARTTGYTCTAVTRCIADAAWTEPGLVPPETLGRREDLFERIVQDLKDRGIRIESRRDLESQSTVR